jgi:hypothetical protein
MRLWILGFVVATGLSHIVIAAAPNGPLVACPAGHYPVVVCRSAPRDFDNAVAVNSFEKIVVCRENYPKENYIALTTSEETSTSVYSAVKVPSSAGDKYRFRENYAVYQLAVKKDQAKLSIAFTPQYTVQSSFDCEE